MHNRQFKDLIERYISGRLDARGKKLLRQLLDDPQYAKELAAIMDQQLEAKGPEYDFPEAVSRIKAAVEEKIAKEKHTPVRFFQRRWVRMAAAAAVIMLLGSAWLIRNIFTGNEKAPAVNTTTSAAIITPGSNKAVLTLANGATVVLDSSGRQEIQQGNATILRQGGQLQYIVQGNTPHNDYNILATPSGGQYQLTLPDGTRVWLNASSSLRYPVVFTGRERRVELRGEAYFEVARNEHMPFTVQAQDMEIAVLGTHFNVTAYTDEGNITTTLLEGSVKVNSSAAAVLLKPGQQALLNNSTGRLQVKQGDTEGAVAWKNGYFKFSSENIQSVMRKISRWYNVQVEYRGDVANKALWGTISRFENISEVLQMLELTGSMHFRIEGRKVIVMP